MGIIVNTSPQQITASVGETQIDVTVSGGIGPSGAVTPSAHAASHAVGGADALTPADIGAAAASDFDQGVKTTDSPTFAAVNVGDWEIVDDQAGAYLRVQHLFGSFTFRGSDPPELEFPNGSLQTVAYTGKIGTTSGLVLKTGTSGVIEALAQGTAGQVLVVNSGATAMEWKTLAAADVGAAASSHAHSATDVTSGTFDIARIPTGTTSTTVSLGNHTHSQLHDRSHAITSTSDHTAGNWKVLYTNGSGQIVELALGAANTVLQSNGASSAPSFAAVSGESFHPFLLAGM